MYTPLDTVTDTSNVHQRLHKISLKSVKYLVKSHNSNVFRL